MQDSLLKAAKAKAKQQFAHLNGVTGFGIGDGTVRVYVLNDDAKKQLPTIIDEVPLEIIVSGEIS